MRLAIRLIFILCCPPVSVDNFLAPFFPGCYSLFRFGSHLQPCQPGQKLLAYGLVFRCFWLEPGYAAGIPGYQRIALAPCNTRLNATVTVTVAIITSAWGMPERPPTTMIARTSEARPLGPNQPRNNELSIASPLPSVAIATGSMRTSVRLRKAYNTICQEIKFDSYYLCT